MKTYEAIFNELETDGVFGISLVENPAMEGLFIALNKEPKTELKLKTVNEEQRILIGLVLEPNKPVYRNQDGEQFNIVFNEDTIKNLSYHFFKSDYHKNSSLEHETRIKGVTFVESWIVADTEKDKSAVYGFSYPKGSWVATMKVDDDEIWNNYVKTGKVQGFSVDAMLQLKEINLKSNNMPKENKNILTALRNALNFSLGETKVKEEEVIEQEVEVKMGMVKSADGEVTFEYEGEELMAGVPLFAVSVDGEKVPVPAGEYPLEGDKVCVVDESGIVTEVKDAMVEEDPAPAEMESASPNFGELEQAIKSILVKYEKVEEENKELKKEIVEFKNSIKDLKQEVVKLSEQPAAKPIRQIAQVELNKNGRILDKIRKN